MRVLKTPTQRFIRWVDTCAKSQAKAAEKLKISKTYASKLYRGDGAPELDVAFRIEDETIGIRGCEIRARDWVGFEPTRTQEGGRRRIRGVKAGEQSESAL